jgi:hypothetical protein
MPLQKRGSMPLLPCLSFSAALLALMLGLTPGARAQTADKPVGEREQPPAGADGKPLSVYEATIDAAMTAYTEGRLGRARALITAFQQQGEPFDAPAEPQSCSPKQGYARLQQALACTVSSPLAAKAWSSVDEAKAAVNAQLRAGKLATLSPYVATCEVGDLAHFESLCFADAERPAASAAEAEPVLRALGEPGQAAALQQARWVRSGTAHGHWTEMWVLSSPAFSAWSAADGWGNSKNMIEIGRRNDGKVYLSALPWSLPARGAK